MRRGEIWWAELTSPDGSEPGFRRPVVVVSDDRFNRSRIFTLIAVALTSNLRLGEAPGNVVLPAARSGLERDSVANVTQVLTLDKSSLTRRAGKVPADLLQEIDAGLRVVLSL